MMEKMVDLSILKIEPGDKIVIKGKIVFDQEEIDFIVEHYRKKFGVEVIFVPYNMDIAILKKDMMT